MNIKKVHIENFKSFKGQFKLTLNRGMNILVGENEAGKSTVLEAIHLALTGLLNGKYLKNELTQYIFNNEIIAEYIKNLDKGNSNASLPYILIEVFMDGDDLAEFEGNGHSEKPDIASGISLKIAFDDQYKDEYEKLIKLGDIKTLPIEYYNVTWSTFARDENITPRTIPIKSALIDSASIKWQNGSDIYLSRILKEFLDSNEIVEISQAHRKMKESFMRDPAIKKINNKIQTASKISEKKIELSVELSTKNAWENSLITYLADIPFHNIGKGEQCIIKTKLALEHKKAKQANIILIEEPENHLSHAKLNQLLSNINENNWEKQILISTHNSFVANKLGLEHLIFLNYKKTIKLNDLSDDTQSFFRKLSGYDTLRLILCKKAILVEGDSDELVVQKAFMINNNGKLPIQMGIDIISVGTSFLRFLEIAEQIGKRVIVVTDNDGNVEAVKTKYHNYLYNNKKEYFKICFDDVVDNGDLEINNKKFNYNTLEPKFLKENGINKLNTILGKSFENENDIHRYMKAEKTECALKIFDSKEEMKFPKYIIDAITND